MKKKPRTTKPKAIPAKPPMSLAQVVLAEAESAVTKEMLACYAAGVFRGPKTSTKKEKDDFARAVLTLAAAGFAFVNYVRDKRREQ